MEATNIKEFYESFQKLDCPAPEEIAVEHTLFEPQCFETTNQSTFSATKDIQKGSLSSLENLNYLNENSFLNSHLADNNNLENTNFLPVVHPVEKSQIFSNQFEARNGNFTFNKTSRKFNDRLERIFNGLENTNIWPNCQFSTTSQTYGVPNDQHFISKSFTNHNNQLGSICHNLTTSKTFSPSQTLHSGQICMQQNEVPQSQYDNYCYNKTNNYDQMENIFSNSRNTNSLTPPTSHQATANQHGPLGNISINIGNIVSSLPCQNSPKSHIFTNHCETANMESNSTLPIGQYFMNTHEIVNQNNFVGNDKHNIRKPKQLPKTILRKYVPDPNFMINGSFVTANHDIKENMENKNHNDQIKGISKTIENIPFRQLGMNGNLRKSSTNPSININNIKSINVHIHHPSNVFSESVADQSVPLMPSPYASPYNLYSNQLNTVSSSQAIKADCCSDGSTSLSTNQNASDAEYTYTYNESTKDAIIRDDIYLPTSEGSSVSADFDEWLNTIQLSHLEIHLGKADTTNILTQSKQVNSSNISAEKKKKTRCRAKIDQDTLNILNMWFETHPYPNHGALETIAAQVGHTVATVRVWFQNRRQKLKRQRHRAISNTNTPSGDLSTGDQDQQYLTSQLVDSAVEYPKSSNTLQMNDDNLNYSVIQVHDPLTTYYTETIQDMSFV